MKQPCDTALSLQHPAEGPLVPFLTVLATALRAQAYAEATVGRYVRLSADFSRWLKENTVFCSNRHRLPLLARAMSRYVPRSALFDQGNRNERADYLDLAR